VTALVALSVLLLCPRALALDPSLDVSQYAHTAWKVREGFSKGYVQSIAQTPDGYLWLGTEFGLLRFDGVRTVPWQPPAGGRLPSSMIWSLLVTRDGTLWIGTIKGLASWKDGKLTLYAELAGQAIARLLQDREGTVWAAGWTFPIGRLCAIQRGVKCYGEDGSLGQGVLSLYEDSRGNLWAGGRTGLWRWKPGVPKLYPVPNQIDGVQDIIEGDDGALLVTVESGITRFVDEKAELYPLAGVGRKFKPGRLLRDRNGGLWIGTRDRSLLHVHKGKTDVFTPSDGLSGDRVASLFEDREGDIWVATIDGLDRFREFAVPTISVKQGLSDPLIGSVLADRDGSVWLGTSVGLNRWNDGQTTIYRKQSGLPDDGIQSMFQDDRGQIWVSTHSGVAFFENGRFIPVSGVPGGQVHSIAEDAAGNIWIANQDLGLFRLSRGKNEVERIPWSKLGHKDHANVLAADPEQKGLWLGFFLGGVAYLKGGQVRASYTAADGLGEGSVASLKLDHDGTLWAATEGGLSRVKNGRVATLTSKNGLPCDTVNSVVEDDAHSFWVEMACGLVRIARPELDAWASDPKRTIQATVFDSSDGFRSHAYAGGYHPRVAKSTDGRLWFLPWDGVSVTDPNHLPINKLLPQVHVEQIVADRKTYWRNSSGDASSSHPRLPPLVRDLTIDYTALSFVAPEKVLFRYKLEGLDRDWQDAGNRRQAFYTNLSPGNYRFRVAACNNSGMWNEAGAFLDFSIAPAYYQTLWFRSLCVLAFLALVYGAYRVRVGQLRAQEEKFRETIESIPAMAFVSQPDGYRTFVNKGWVEYTGITVEQSLGSGWHAAIHPGDLKRVLGEWEAALASGKPMYYEARYQRVEDGQYRWFMVRVVPQRNKRGKIVKWFGTLTDIEDRKRAEEERETLRADLAHVNRVSTLGEMAASLAHEIKQPIAAAITSANTCVEWLAHEPPNLDRARAAAGRIDKYGNRAAEIIDRIRALYKKSPPQRELVEINEIVREMVELLRAEANQYAVSIRTDLVADLPKISADRVQLRQVFMNLILNAIEAMKETGGVLTLKTQLGETGQLLILVSDTGVGLPKEETEHIFDAFFTTKAQGSGMGLSISRSIVESHGGRLWATANNGRGATFHFTLPTAAETSQMPATGT
jgi:PAS domain S-box-containing protein